jgi:CheY-like chemotaxis protein
MTTRVLIVDDEFGLADIVAEILREHGLEATIAINGKQGLEALAEQVPDLVLLDVMMPVLDGPGMLRAMRADPAYAAIPVIMMTALREALPKDTSMYQAVLLKPFSEQALFTALGRLLGQNFKAAQ